MKTPPRLVSSLGLVLLVGLASSAARAAESSRDRETDHLDGFDDGGPRSVGLLVDPGALALGAFALEADRVLGDAAVVSVEGDYVSVGAASAVGGALGLVLFPQGVPFHGFYLDPRVSLARVTDGGAATLFGGGATLGWEWTLRVGLTLRAGGGASFTRAVAGSVTSGLDGLHPLVDGSVGWVF
jgi:hypothetical protein